MGMIALKCPQCGADIQLDDTREFGFCNYCGTKVMQDKVVVEHTGAVVIDESDALEKLYKAARNARDASDDLTALRHYENLSAKDPDNWEPVYYSAVLKTSNITNGEIGSATILISNCLPKTISLIANLETNEQKKSAVEEVVDDVCIRAQWLDKCSYQYYLSIQSATNLSNYKNRTLNIANMVRKCGVIIETFGDMTDNDYKSLVIKCFKQAIYINNSYGTRSPYIGNLYDDESLERISNEIRKYDPSFPPFQKKQSGCYVATAIYGSYNCPEVWTLRRFRDNSLALTWYGRLFITLYYAISPTIVKWFGQRKWFNKMWRGKLDRMVEKLHSEGYEDTPYEDKKW